MSENLLIPKIDIAPMPWSSIISSLESLSNDPEIQKINDKMQKINNRINNLDANIISLWNNLWDNISDIIKGINQIKLELNALKQKQWVNERDLKRLDSNLTQIKLQLINKISKLSVNLNTKIDAVKNKANKNWDDIEGLIKMSRALADIITKLQKSNEFLEARLGLKVNSLQSQIDEINKKINVLLQQSANMDKMIINESRKINKAEAIANEDYQESIKNIFKNAIDKITDKQLQKKLENLFYKEFNELKDEINIFNTPEKHNIINASNVIDSYNEVKELIFKAIKEAKKQELINVVNKNDRKEFTEEINKIDLNLWNIEKYSLSELRQKVNEYYENIYKKIIIKIAKQWYKNNFDKLEKFYNKKTIINWETLSYWQILKRAIEKYNSENLQKIPDGEEEPYFIQKYILWQKYPDAKAYTKTIKWLINYLKWEPEVDQEKYKKYYKWIDKKYFEEKITFLNPHRKEYLPGSVYRKEREKAHILKLEEVKEVIMTVLRNEWIKTEFKNWEPSKADLIAYQRLRKAWADWKIWLNTYKAVLKDLEKINTIS